MRSLSRRVLCVATWLMFASCFLCAQGGQGTITVNVADQTGNVIPGATLTLHDLSTNDIRNAKTQQSGVYSFVGLPIGTYSLTATAAGFQTQVFQSVVVQAAQTTDLNVQLNVGQVAQTVQVNEVTPLMDTTSNAISDTVDMKQLEDLPIQGRNVVQLSSLIPGFTGTWNGLPSAAQSNSVDGVAASESRRKFMGNAQPLAQARLEDIAEMTVQTDQLDLNQGFGQGDMQLSFVTRRGTNSFHGRAYEDFQNSALNASSWYNDANGLPKNHLILNDFGFSLGGPILHNKLFFFGSLGMSRQPGTTNGNNSVLTAAAQGGDYIFTGTDGQVHTVNLLTEIAKPNGLPYTVNSTVAKEQAEINQSLTSGTVRATGDPNIQTVSWLAPSPVTMYFPTVRLDYNISEKYRLDFAWNETRNLQPTAALPLFPGSGFTDQTAGNKLIYYTTSLGFDWTVSPTFINQFRGGLLYAYSDYAYNAKPIWEQEPAVTWGLTSSGQAFPNLPTSNFYPTITGTDTLTWQHGAHTVAFGFSYFREQDHYWNPPSGFANYSLGLASGDPALSDFASSSQLSTATPEELGEAEKLYAQLVGRISSVAGSHAYNPKLGSYLKDGQYGSYNLDELQQAWGLFLQDSYHLKPNLTLNYGLRWDFTGDDHDLTGAYHTLTLASVWGPSGINQSFQPGVLNGDTNPQFVAEGHQYQPWNISPQPEIGVAWNPGVTSGFMKGILGGHETVIRAGFSLRRFTEPYQYFWDAGTNYGAFFNQRFFLQANTNFSPGTLALGDTLPAYDMTPIVYPSTYDASATTFVNPFESNSPLAATGVDPNIKQPYVQSWNFGIQRSIGANNVLELRYIGSRSIHQWVSVNTNEVNIFESGFLSDFKRAQANLKANAASGQPNSFSNNGLTGQQAMPIIDAAFANVPANLGYSDGAFIQLLQTGQAGAFAAELAGGLGGKYFCNLVPKSFVPCGPGGTAEYTGAGGSNPINLFQANPYFSGQEVGLMTSAGYSTYNGLQVDLRQKQWHGMQFDVNYTWSHTLGLEPAPTQWTGQFSQFSLRNLSRSYVPTAYDIRHVIHWSGTYDLPFGKGKRFANNGGVSDKVIGGWTLATILTAETGAPYPLLGGYRTYNDYGDGGIDLNGVTRAELQASSGIYRVPGRPFVDLINPKYLVSATGGGANPSYITPHSDPGSFGQNMYLYGPHFTEDDISITKSVPIRESLRFMLQGEFLNAFNHPNFGSDFNNPETQGLVNGFNLNTTTVQNNGFGTASGPTTGARVIELRANIEF
jgi:hypothetical protein